MKKQIVIMLLCSVMAFSTCACGGNESGTTGKVESTEQNNTEKAENTEKEEKKESPLRKSYETIYYSGTEVMSRDYYEYDKKGRETLAVTEIETEKNEITTTWEDIGNTAIGTQKDDSVPSVNFTINHQYDENGNLLKSEKSVEYEGQNIVMEKTENQYDENGNLLKSENYSASDIDQFELTSFTECEYQNNVLIEKTTSNLFGVSTTRYDEHGNVTYDKRIYREEVVSEVTSEYTFDKNGDIQSVVTTNQDGERNSGTYVYDKKGNLTEINYESGNRETYTYDAKGNVIEVNNGDNYMTTYTYDEEGNILEQLIYENGTLSMKYVYTYYYE